MHTRDWASVTPKVVLDFWFPDDGHDSDLETHRAFWMRRMRGGMDDAICGQHAELTEAAARGQLDHWAATPRGRLALVIVLDQFSRSLWRGTPGAFGQDIKAADLVLEAFANGDYDALPNVWEKAFCLIAVGHAEGPGHLDRMRDILVRSRALVEAAPAHLRPGYLIVEEQNRLAHDVIARFGRHSHRNVILGRVSTPEEEAYIAAGDFPHVRNIPPSENLGKAQPEARGSATA